MSSVPNRLKYIMKCAEKAERYYSLGNYVRASVEAKECLKALVGGKKLARVMGYDGIYQQLLVIEKRLRNIINDVYNVKTNGKPKSKPVKNSIKTEQNKGEEDERLPIKKPTLTLSDLVGLEKIREFVLSKIEMFVRHREITRSLKMRPPKGVLLFGPPGCGKTSLAEAIAGEFGYLLIISSASAILSKRRGESEKRVRKMFEIAKEHAPSVILIDEVDTLVPIEASEHSRRLKGEFLQNLESINDRDKFVFVVMTTNYPENLDPALIRPGRVDLSVYLPPPNFEIRRALFRTFLKDLPKEDLDYDELADITRPKNGSYYTHASIKEIVEMAKMYAGKEAIDRNEQPRITLEHIKRAASIVNRPVTEERHREYLARADKHGAAVPYEEID